MFSPPIKEQNLPRKAVQFGSTKCSEMMEGDLCHLRLWPLATYGYQTLEKWRLWLSNWIILIDFISHLWLVAIVVGRSARLYWCELYYIMIKALS